MEELIICKECGDQTSTPPDERAEEWGGLCPLCVVKKFVLPLIEDEMLRELAEHMMTIQPIMAVAIPASMIDNPEDFSEKMRQSLLHDQVSRDKLQELLDLLNRERPLPKVQQPKPDRPVVKNNPKWS